MKKVDKDHLEDIEQGYFQHMFHAFTQSNRLIVIALKSYIHGVLPWFFSGDGPRQIYKIYKELRHMHHAVKIFKEYDKQSKNE
jgi:hypothetical protein